MTSNIFMNTPIRYKIIITISWFISLVLFFISPADVSSGFMSFSLLNVAICTFVFFLYHKHIYKKITYVSLTFLFVISMIITHFQIAIAHVIGFEIDNDLFFNFIWADSKIGNLSIAVSSLGLISFYLGHVFTERKKQIKITEINHIYNYGYLLQLLTFLSIIFYFLFFITSGSYKYGNYAAGDQLTISNYFFNIFNICIKSALIIKMYLLNFETNKIHNLKDYILFIGIPLSCIVLWHIFFSIYIGDRGPVIIFGVLYFGLYLIRIFNKKYNLILLSAFFFMSILFSVLGASRSRVGNESFSSKINSSDYESRYSTNFSQDNMLGLSTLELALSARCLNHTIANVPSNYDYKYGLYQLKQVLAGVPFLVGFLNEYVINGKEEEASSADFVTFLIQGKNSNYGDATTPVADLYLDFGAIGVLFGFFIFGCFAKRSDLIILFGGHTSLLNWIFIMFYWTGAIYLGRASFLYYFQTAIQVYLFIVILNSLKRLK
jgi:hypothetical protein